MGNIINTIEVNARELYLDEMIRDVYTIISSSERIKRLEVCLEYAKLHNLNKQKYTIEEGLIHEKLKPIW